MELFAVTIVTIIFSTCYWVTGMVAYYDYYKTY